MPAFKCKQGRGARGTAGEHAILDHVVAVVTQHRATTSPREAGAALPRRPPARQLGRVALEVDLAGGGMGVKVWFVCRGNGTLSARGIFLEKSGKTIVQLSLCEPSMKTGRYRFSVGSTINTFGFEL